jgi:hypothetical protein
VIDQEERMGHYAALVIHRPEQTVDELLAPYDMNVEFPEREVPCSCIGWRSHRDPTLPGIPRRFTKGPEKTPDPNCDLCEGTGRFITSGNPNGQWDWYLIGGQFSGVLTGYKAWEDPINYEVCPFCNGTGQCTGIDSVIGCNGCSGTGKHQKHPSQWKPYPDDTMRVSSLLHSTPDFVPCAVVTPSGEWLEEGLVSRYVAAVEGLEQKQARLRELLSPYPDCLITVVDLHF